MTDGLTNIPPDDRGPPRRPFSMTALANLRKELEDLPPPWEEIAVRDEATAARLRGACMKDPGPVTAGSIVLGLRVVLDPSLPEGDIELRRIGHFVRTSFAPPLQAPPKGRS